MPNVLIDYDKITIEGTVIKRPARIAPSDWLAFWEQLQKDPNS